MSGGIPIELLRIEAPIADIGNMQMACEPEADADLGFKMWGGKDAQGNATKFLAKGKASEVKSQRITDLENQQDKNLQVDANGNIIAVAPPTIVEPLAFFEYVPSDVFGTFYIGGIRKDPAKFLPYEDASSDVMLLVIESSVCCMTALVEFFADASPLQPKVTILRHTGRSDSPEGSPVDFQVATGATNGRKYVKVITGWTGYGFIVRLSSLDTKQSDALLLAPDSTGFVNEVNFTTPNLLRYDTLQPGTGIAVAVDEKGNRRVDSYPVTAGVTSYPAPEWFSTGLGTLKISACDALLYTNANYVGKLQQFHIAESVEFTLMENVAYLIIIDYNAGTPIYSLVEEVIGNWNHANKVPVYRLWFDNGEIHSVSVDSLGIGSIGKILELLGDTQYYRRAFNDGMIINQTTASPFRRIWITGSVYFAGSVKIVVGAFNSVMYPLKLYYNNGVSWVYNTTEQYDNTNLNVNAGLVPLGNNKWGTRWFYRSIGDTIEAFYVLGQGEYNTEAEANLEMERQDLPVLLKKHCVLVGKVLIKNGTDYGTLIPLIGNTAGALGGESTDDHLVFADSNDVVPGTLATKLDAGTNITLSVEVVDGVRKVRITAAGGSGSTTAKYAATLMPSACSSNVAVAGGSSEQWTANLTMLVSDDDLTITAGVSELAVICPQVVSGASYILAIYKWVDIGQPMTLVCSSAVTAMPGSSSWLTALVTNKVANIIGGERYYAALMWNANGATLQGVYGQNMNVQPYIAGYKANMGVLTAAPTTLTLDGEQGQHFFLRVKE